MAPNVPPNPNDTVTTPPNPAASVTAPSDAQLAALFAKLRGGARHPKTAGAHGRPRMGKGPVSQRNRKGKGKDKGASS